MVHFDSRRTQVHLSCAAVMFAIGCRTWTRLPFLPSARPPGPGECGGVNDAAGARSLSSASSERPGPFKRHPNRLDGALADALWGLHPGHGGLQRNPRVAYRRRMRGPGLCAGDSPPACAGRAGTCQRIRSWNSLARSVSGLSKNVSRMITSTISPEAMNTRRSATARANAIS